MKLLHHEQVTANGEPTYWLYVLHGIFGTGRNWGSVARRVVRERPEWGALLIDLRQHGRSHGFPPPHTVEAAAADLGELALQTGHLPDAVLGHSFGGKVALMFASGAAGHAAVQSLRQVWVVDSTPEAREPGGSAWAMMQLVREGPPRFATRDEAIARISDAGFAAPVAHWMATNLESGDDGYRWRFDAAALEQLLESFFRTDAWQVVESPPANVEMHLVKAEESSVLDGDALARAERASSHGRTFVHRVDGGHWVNSENPDAIERLLVQLLPGA
jgi:pimeloyl-ACP methyl ester carboxylesterase